MATSTAPNQDERINYETNELELKGDLLYTAHIDELTYNPDNLRGDLNRPDLLAQLNADGRVLTPLIVYPSDFDIDGKKVVFEGNSRLFAMNQEAYTGSKIVNYILLPEDIAGDPDKEDLFIISLGTTNEQLTPVKVGKGFAQIVDRHIQQTIEETANWNELEEKKQNAKKKKARKTAIDKIMAATGKSERYVHILLAAAAEAEGSNLINEALETKQITPTMLEVLSNVAEKVDVPLENALILAKKAMHQADKPSVSLPIINQVKDLYQQPEEVVKLVDDNLLPFSLVGESVKAAEEANTDVASVISEAMDYGELSTENLEKAVISLKSDASDFAPEVETVEEEAIEEDENPEEILEKVAEAKDQIASFGLFIGNLQAKEFEGLSAEEVIKLSLTLQKLEVKIEKKINLADVVEE